MTSHTDLTKAQSLSTPLPAGGVSSPPMDPPAASGKPLEGQIETNKSINDRDEATDAASTLHGDDEALWRAAAIALGRRSYANHANGPLQFEQAEDELAREWETQQQRSKQRISWEEAREFARDAWDEARSALESGDAKPSAR